MARPRRIRDFFYFNALCISLFTYLLLPSATKKHCLWSHFQAHCEQRCNEPLSNSRKSKRHEIKFVKFFRNVHNTIYFKYRNIPDILWSRLNDRHEWEWVVISRKSSWTANDVQLLAICNQQQIWPDSNAFFKVKAEKQFSKFNKNNPFQSHVMNNNKIYTVFPKKFHCFHF